MALGPVELAPGSVWLPWGGGLTFTSGREAARSTGMGAGVSVQRDPQHRACASWDSPGFWLPSLFGAALGVQLPFLALLNDLSGRTQVAAAPVVGPLEWAMCGFTFCCQWQVPWRMARRGRLLSQKLIWRYAGIVLRLPYSPCSLHRASVPWGRSLFPVSPGSRMKVNDPIVFALGGQPKI